MVARDCPEKQTESKHLDFWGCLGMVKSHSVLV